MARTVVYGSNRLTIEDDSLSNEDIKASMADIFPELKNSQYEVRDNELHFTVKAGTKGMARTVVYGSNRLTIEDDSLSNDDIKASMADIFPELKNSQYEVRGNELHFTVKAGTKGMARTVVYGSNRLTIEDDSLSNDDIKASMADIFPELKNSQYEVRGNELHFTVKAGTKGMARTVVYGSNRLSIEDDSLSNDDIKASMADIFPELKNSQYEVRGNELHFTVKAGTKGIAAVFQIKE